MSTLLAAMREYAETGDSPNDPRLLMRLAVDHVAMHDKLLEDLRVANKELAQLRELRNAVRLIGRWSRDET